MAKLRWRIERDYQDHKQEFGLGHFEGRSWRGFHHHATLCIAAYAFLLAERVAGPKKTLHPQILGEIPALPHYLVDWNYDEDRSHIRTDFGPANITRLRRFAIGILKSFQKPAQSIAAMMRKLSFRTRLVFDYLRMTKKLSNRSTQLLRTNLSCPHPRSGAIGAGFSGKLRGW